MRGRSRASVLHPVQECFKDAFGLWGPMVDASADFKWEEFGLDSLQPKIETMQKIAVSTVQHIISEIVDAKAKAESVSNEFNVFLTEDDWQLDKFKEDVKAKGNGGTETFKELKDCSPASSWSTLRRWPWCFKVFLLLSAITPGHLRSVGWGGVGWG